jgi:hypothetical protein
LVQAPQSANDFGGIRFVLQFEHQIVAPLGSRLAPQRNEDRKGKYKTSDSGRGLSIGRDPGESVLPRKIVPLIADGLPA